MPGDKYTRNIIVYTDAEPDNAVRESGAMLARKVGFEGSYLIGGLPKFSDGHCAGARIYVHGHADWYGISMGGMAPEAVAGALAASNIAGVALISITGCNSARGFHVGGTADAVQADLQWRYEEEVDHRRGNGVAHSRTFPGINSNNFETRKGEDSRLVDTGQSAAQLCIGSFAQRFHRALLDHGIDVPVHARLFVVITDDDEDGRVHKYTMHTKLQQKGRGQQPVAAEWPRHKAARSKIRITSGDAKAINGQNFAYVDYNPAGTGGGH